MSEDPFRGTSNCEHGLVGLDCPKCKDAASPTLTVGESTSPNPHHIVWSREAIAEWLYQRGMQGGFPGDTENSRQVLRAHAIQIQNGWFNGRNDWPPGYAPFKAGGHWVWHRTNREPNEASIEQWKTSEEARVAAWADFRPAPTEEKPAVEFRKTKEGEPPGETEITFTTSDASQFVELVTVKPDGTLVLSPAFFEAVRAATPTKEPSEDAGITIIKGGGEGGIYDGYPWYASGGKWWGNAPREVREKYQAAEPKGEPPE